MRDNIEITLWVFLLGIVIVLLSYFGYVLHIFNTLQFLVGFGTGSAIAGACINHLFFPWRED